MIQMTGVRIVKDHISAPKLSPGLADASHAVRVTTAVRGSPNSALIVYNSLDISAVNALRTEVVHSIQIPHGNNDPVRGEKRPLAIKALYKRENMAPSEVTKILDTILRSADPSGRLMPRVGMYWELIFANTTLSHAAIKELYDYLVARGDIEMRGSTYYLAKKDSGSKTNE